MPQTIRTFIALDLTYEFRSALDAQLRLIRAKFNQNIKWDDPTKFHLTLAFLGDTDPNILPAIKAACAEAAAKVDPFTLAFDHAGSFPPKGIPAVLWISCAEQPALSQLAMDLRAALRQRHIMHDKKPFRPHLTVARARRSIPRQYSEKLITEFGAMETSALPAQTIKWVTIYQSELRPQGAIYTALARFEL